MTDHSLRPDPSLKECESVRDRQEAAWVIGHHHVGGNRVLCVIDIWALFLALWTPPRALMQGVRVTDRPISLALWGVGVCQGDEHRSAKNAKDGGDIAETLQLTHA